MANNWEDAPKDGWETYPGALGKATKPPVTQIGPSGAIPQTPEKQSFMDSLVERITGQKLTEEQKQKRENVMSEFHKKAWGTGVESAAYKAGGGVTDITGSPALGYATNVAAQAIPALFGGQLAKGAAPAFESISKKLMQSAVKPTLEQLKKGEASRAIDTMLKEGISPTKGGVEKLRSMISVLDQQVSDLIAKSPEVVKKGNVGKRLVDVYEKFKNQVNPESDLKAIRTAWREFMSHPALKGAQDIPVKLAQKLKTGTYKQLAEKAYGELGTAATESQKALARGLREEIAAKVPGVVEPLKKEAELMNALNVAERRALMALNSNPIGLPWLTRNPEIFAAFMADKSSAFKAIVARMIYSSSERIPQAFGMAVGGGLGAMSGQPPAEPIPPIPQQ